MYQGTRDGSGYALEWRGARVDSSGFAPGHENPRQIPLREREWRAPVSLDGRPVPGDVLMAPGKWQQFRPNSPALPRHGRASCRETSWQYVYITVVAALLTKKIRTKDN